MVRAFIAIELSPEMRQAMAGAQESIRASSAKLTLVDPAIIHITLKFLGEVDEKSVPRVIGAMRAIHFAPYELTIRRIRGNNKFRPRVVWGEAEDGGKSAALNALLDNALEPLGFEREERKFTPHATLARVREFHPSLLDRIRMLAEYPSGSCTIGGMKLKKSTLTPRGPVYEDIVEVVF
jgi:2'-5' RNA ligase